jgi:hypothetical protein
MAEQRIMPYGDVLSNEISKTYSGGWGKGV